MRSVASILLAICYLALGTGALEYVHNLQHAAEDAREDAVVQASSNRGEHHHQHDETNCDIHAQLHMAMFVTHWVPLLICLGLFVAFLSLLDAPLIGRLLPARIDCRGPPAACSFL